MIDFSNESHDDNHHVDAKMRALIEIGVLTGAGKPEAMTHSVQSALVCDASADEIAMAVCVGTAIKAYAQMLENLP